MKFEVNCNSVEESNIYLRKLWYVFNEITTMGTYFYNEKDVENNIVTIGDTNIGTVRFTYKKKGCIKDIIIDNLKCDETALYNACQKALTIKEKTYFIKICFKKFKDNKVHSKIKLTEANTKKSLGAVITNNFPHRLIYNSTYKKVHIFNDGKNNYLTFPITAFCEWDLKTLIQRLFPMICAILFEYSFSLMDISKCEYTELNEDVNLNNDYECEEICFNWIDEDEIPNKDGQVLLPIDCLKIIDYIISNNIDDNIDKIIASAIILYSTQKIHYSMLNSNEPGISDIINNMGVTSIEPLSNIIYFESKRCEVCNTEIYSIVKKIKFLVANYFDESFAKYFIKKYYTERSKFFHVGLLKTTSVLHEKIIPQIDKNGELESPTPFLDINLTDYISYIFRMLVHDVLNESIPIFQP